ncbi:unnamed protein product [Brassica rapa subsp. narinosa]
MFLIASNSPTGMAFWKTFHKKSLTFGDVRIFQTLLNQSSSGWSPPMMFSSSLILIATLYPVFVVYSPVGVLR